MANFSVKINQLNTSEQDIFNLSGDLMKEYSKMDSVYKNFPNLGSSTSYFRYALKKVMDKAEAENIDLKELSTKFGQVLDCYIKTEQNILNYEELDCLVNPIDKINNIQGTSYGNYTDYAELIANSDELSEEEKTFLENVLDYIGTGFWQALVGDFTDDGNLLGVILSIGVGCIPVVGQIADVRDLVADIYNLIDDGPTTAEWIALGCTVVGFLPLIGDLGKHADEVGDLLRRSDVIKKIVDPDSVTDVLKHVDEMAEGVKNSRFVRKASDLIKSPIDGAKQIANNVVEKVDDFLHSGSSDGFINAVGNVIEKTDNVLKKGITIPEYTIGVSNFESEVFNGYKVIKETISDYVSDFGQSTLAEGIDFLLGRQPEASEQGV